MDELRKLTLRRKRAHSKFLKMDSKVYKSFLDLESTTYRDGALSAKMKELVAVGISAAVNCESCIQWHTEAALREGATEHDVLEALEVAIEIGGGRAVATARLALEVMEGLEKEGHEPARY